MLCCFTIITLPVSYTISLGFITPIRQIIHSDAGGALRIDVLSDTDAQVIFTMFYSENAEDKPLLSTASIAAHYLVGSIALRGISAFRHTLRKSCGELRLWE